LRLSLGPGRRAVDFAFPAATARAVAPLRQQASLDGDGDSVATLVTDTRPTRVPASVERGARPCSDRILVTRPRYLLAPRHPLAPLQILEHPTSGLRQLLREGRKEDLVRLFRLLMRVQTGVACIARVARRYYCEEALQAVHAARGAASDDAFAGVEAAASSSASGRCCSASCADATMGGSCESATCSVWQPTSARSECTDGAASGEPQHWLLPDIPPRDALSPEALAALRDLHKRERAVIKSIFSGHHRLEEALRDVLAAPLALDAAAPAPVGRR